MKPVSVHGGHSGEFCVHAQDRLEDIIRRYIEEGFAWVGITEHAPPPGDDLRYPDETAQGLTAAALQENFSHYIRKARHLKTKYAGQLPIFIGFETEAYDNYVETTRQLVNAYQVDYIVGSVHHIDNMCFDFSKAMYQAVCKFSGGIDGVYKKYFDKQYELICKLQPAVVGHFDLVRIHDPDYEERLRKPAIRDRIERNLEKIKTLDLILDFNTRPFKKGGKEPYVSRRILKRAKQLDIKVVPGDDSHGVSDIGADLRKGMEILRAEGFDTPFPEPRIYQFGDTM